MKESRIKVRYRGIDLRINRDTYRELKAEAAKEGVSTEQVIAKEVNDWYIACQQVPFHLKKYLSTRPNRPKLRDREHSSEVSELSALGADHLRQLVALSNADYRREHLAFGKLSNDYIREHSSEVIEEILALGADHLRLLATLSEDITYKEGGT